MFSTYIQDIYPSGNEDRALLCLYFLCMDFVCIYHFNFVCVIAYRVSHFVQLAFVGHTRIECTCSISTEREFTKYELFILRSPLTAGRTQPCSCEPAVFSRGLPYSSHVVGPNCLMYIWMRLGKACGVSLFLRLMTVSPIFVCF